MGAALVALPFFGEAFLAAAGLAAAGFLAAAFFVTPPVVAFLALAGDLVFLGEDLAAAFLGAAAFLAGAALGAALEAVAGAASAAGAAAVEAAVAAFLGAAAFLVAAAFLGLGDPVVAFLGFAAAGFLALVAVLGFLVSEGFLSPRRKDPEAPTPLVCLKRPVWTPRLRA